MTDTKRFYNRPNPCYYHPYKQVCFDKLKEEDEKPEPYSRQERKNQLKFDLPRIKDFLPRS